MPHTWTSPRVDPLLSGHWWGIARENNAHLTSTGRAYTNALRDATTRRTRRGLC